MGKVKGKNKLRERKKLKLKKQKIISNKKDIKFQKAIELTYDTDHAQETELDNSNSIKSEYSKTICGYYYDYLHSRNYDNDVIDRMVNDNYDYLSDYNRIGHIGCMLRSLLESHKGFFEIIGKIDRRLVNNEIDLDNDYDIVINIKEGGSEILQRIAKESLDTEEWISLLYKSVDLILEKEQKKRSKKVYAEYSNHERCLLYQYQVLSYMFSKINKKEVENNTELHEWLNVILEKEGHYSNNYVY